MIVLPRQAQDEYKESTQKEIYAFSAGNGWAIP
jgi:hypothetical protein